MTTIAWDGTTLAADTQIVTSFGSKRPGHKIYVGDARVFGGVGGIANCQRIAAWLLNGEPKPTLEGEDGEGTNGIVIDRATGGAWIVEGKLCDMLPLEPGPFAIGSGRDSARAAMALGHSAVDAVLLASKLDAWTGGEIESITPVSIIETGTSAGPYRMCRGHERPGSHNGKDVRA